MSKFSLSLPPVLFIIVILGVPVIIKLVFEALTDSLFALNQLLISDNSLLILFVSLQMSSLENRIVVSSAKSMKSKRVDVLVMSLIYKIKSNGPNIDP